MTTYRIGEAAELLGVSVDTMRRWVDAGRLPAGRDDHGHRTIAGADLAVFARGEAEEPDPGIRRSSARNRLRGIITAITRDAVPGFQDPSELLDVDVDQLSWASSLSA